MSNRFVVTIKVAYKRGTAPEDIQDQLANNVSMAIQRGLLADAAMEAEVDDYHADVVEKRWCRND